MTKKVLFSEAEIATPKDFADLSGYSVEADENITGDAIGYPNHWANFTIATPTANTVQINEGRLFQGAQVFDLDDSHDIGMIGYLPLVAGDQKYIAIMVRGKTEPLSETRLVETDAETEATAFLSVPKTEFRTCEFVVLQGLSSPTPIKPVVPANDCAIAYILLGTAGIISVEAASDYRVKTLYEVEGRLTLLEEQMIIAFSRTQNLETDLANLQGSLDAFARRDVVRQLQEDVGRVRRMLNLPDTARAYFYDPALTNWAWSKTHVSWDARVDEGLRFPFAASEDVQLAVQNPAQDGIKIVDDILMLDYVENTRIEVDGSGSTKDISQLVHSIQKPVARSVSRSSISFGPTVAVCGNTAEYSGFDSAATGQSFQKGGETFQKVAVINSSFSNDSVNLNDFNNTHTGTYDVDKVVLHNSQVGQTGNREIYAARSVQVNSWTETYWDMVTEEFSINGSIYAQTFLLTQPMILTSIELKFDRVGASGNVQLLLVETSPSGEPLFDRVVTRTTLAHGSLASGWVKFPFTPRFLPPGKRYAWVTVTSGNHSLRTVTGSKFTEGSLFWSTDQAWFQGSPTEDFAFRVNSTAHTNTRAQVLFDPLTLPGGMTEIKLLYESWYPEGTAMIWEVRTSGTAPWTVIEPETADRPNPLRDLPPTCQLRLTLIGLSGMSPAIILNENARGETHRHKFAGRAISKDLEFGLTTTTIDAEWTLDMFDDALHTVVPKIMVGAAEIDANAVTITQDLQKPERRIVKADFTVPLTATARTILDMATTDIQAVPFVENTALYAA